MPETVDVEPLLVARLRGLAARWKLRRCVSFGRSVRAFGRVWVHGPGKVRLGDRVVLDASWAPIELKTIEPSSEIVIGDDVYIAGGTSIEAVVSVIVGARSRLGRFSKLLDNHFHPLVGDRHWRPPSAPVRVGEDVKVGARAILLAGAQVESRATIRAGTVITRRVHVAPGRTASGLPAVVE